MKLLTAKASPFGRKVWIAILHNGLGDRIPQVDANPFNADDPLQSYNPLGRVPVLVLDDDTAIVESTVIMMFLDQLLGGGGRLLPVDARDRIAELQGQALADGIMEAGALIVAEGRMRPVEKRHMPVVERLRDKIRLGLAALAKAPPDPRRVQAASIALACALGFLDRRGQYDWRSAQPSLVAWLDTFRAACPAYDQTHVPPEPGWVSP